jgi:hypothetical protein
MRTRKTKTRTRIKTEIRTNTRTKARTTARPLLRPTALACVGAILAVAAAATASGQATSTKKTAYAVIAGTVFRDPGFSQPGAAVWLTRKDDPKQKKLHEAVSDARGEFAFRVPPAQAAYELHATLKGYRPVREDIEIGGEEQVNATLLLVPESK